MSTPITDVPLSPIERSHFTGTSRLRRELLLPGCPALVGGGTESGAQYQRTVLHDDVLTLPAYAVEGGRVWQADESSGLAG